MNKKADGDFQFGGTRFPRRAISLQSFDQFIKTDVDILQIGMIYAAKQRFDSWAN